MRLIARVRGERYCAYCKSPRMVYTKKHVDLTNVVLTFALALGFSSVAWGWLDPRAATVWPVLLIGTEIFIFLRWRLGLECSLCGFDPVIYKKSPAEAARRVGQFYSEKTKTSDFFLTRSPLLEVYKELQQKQRKKAEYERVLNKSQTQAPVTPPALKNSKGSQISKTV